MAIKRPVSAEMALVGGKEFDHSTVHVRRKAGEAEKCEFRVVNHLISRVSAHVLKSFTSRWLAAP